MTTTRTLTPAAALIVATAIGSALTRHTHRLANVVSNVCSFAVALLTLFFVGVALVASIRGVRKHRRTAD